ncbi:unnamed protein product [Aureobasidium pullulans]|nr:unnamed protein product [Aureobasidium pullulans]
MDSKRNNDREALSALDAEILGYAAGSDTDMEEAEDMELDDSSSSSDASVSGGKSGNARNQWHENNPLLREISLNKLDDYGYVNLETICVDKALATLVDECWKQQGGAPNWMLPKGYVIALKNHSH